MTLRPRSQPVSASAIAIVFVLASLTTNAFAQGKAEKKSTELSSVSEVSIEINPLSGQAQQCGIAAGDLDASTRAALGTSALKVNKSATNFVLVSANAVANADQCFASINVELFRWAKDYGVSASVWGHQALIVGPADGFNTRVREKVDALTKEFIAEWQKAKQ
jgi:hypothetical protein